MNNLLPQDGILLFEESFLTPKESEELFIHLKNSLNWEQKEIMMYDKLIKIPRLTAWIGEDVYYAYSNIDNQPQPWTELLLKLKQKIEDKYGIKLNGCLANLYRTGKDHISWHSDNEKELGENPAIASISLGAERSFQVKHKYLPLEKVILPLSSGSLVVMKGAMQKKWLHRVAPTTKPVEERINLTFRFIYK